MDEQKVITIGDFNIFRWDKDSIWLGRPSGEGGAFSEDKLYKVIAEFYNNNF